MNSDIKVLKKWTWALDQWDACAQELKQVRAQLKVRSATLGGFKKLLETHTLPFSNGKLERQINAYLRVVDRLIERRDYLIEERERCIAASEAYSAYFKVKSEEI